MEERLKLFIYPGKLFTSEAPYYLSTILGSCVAVCIYDDVKKIGGMNHYMLPLWNGEGLASPKYGNVAIDLLINRMLRLGCTRRNLKAKIFGGASVISTKQDMYNIGERNIQIAEDILEKEKIRIIAQSVGGDRGRKILMDTINFQIRHKYIEKKHF